MTESTMHAPLTDTFPTTASRIDSRRAKRLAGLAVAAYALCLPVAMLAGPVGLVVVFDQPVTAALEATLVGVALGYAPLLALVGSARRPLAPESG
ncbi:MAG: hypothetical protein ABEH77_10885 [Halobacteriaceae archaeon]